jgi:hypothetical protein
MVEQQSRCSQVRRFAGSHVPLPHCEEPSNLGTCEPANGGLDRAERPAIEHGTGRAARPDRPEFHFDLATPADGPAIRRLLRENPVPGRVTVTYEREPDYFCGCATMGRFHQTLVARRRPGGELAALLCRAVRPRFVNGHEEQVGYLGQLRVDARHRGRWIVPRGVEALRTLHTDGRAEAYLASIIDGSREARGILVDHRRGSLPAFHELDRLCTLALVVRRRRAFARSAPAACAIDRGSAAELGAIVAFLREHGAAKQLFPAYAEDDFGPGGTTPGFRVEDFLVARRAGRIAGVLGLWDQSAYKQTVVQGYAGLLGRARPLYNAGARLLGAQALPPPGAPIRHAYASFVCVANDDPAVFDALLRRALDLAAARRHAYLMVGLSARDPLLPVARRQDQRVAIST